MAKLQSDLSEFVGLLNSRKVEYAVVGGHAVALDALMRNKRASDREKDRLDVKTLLAMPSAYYSIVVRTRPKTTQTLRVCAADKRSSLFVGRPGSGPPAHVALAKGPKCDGGAWGSGFVRVDPEPATGNVTETSGKSEEAAVTKKQAELRHRCFVCFQGKASESSKFGDWCDRQVSQAQWESFIGPTCDAKCAGFQAVSACLGRVARDQED